MSHTTAVVFVDFPKVRPVTPLKTVEVSILLYPLPESNELLKGLIVTFPVVLKVFV